MKQQLLTLLFLILFSVSARSQREIDGCIVTMKESTGDKFISKNDTLTVEINPSDLFWDIKLTNNLKKDIRIVWEKSNFIPNGEASRIIFGNVSRLLMNAPNMDQEIPAGTFILKRIFPISHVGSNYLIPTIKKKYVKMRLEKGTVSTVQILLAIGIGDELKKYSYNFEITPKVK